MCGLAKQSMTRRCPSVMVCWFWDRFFDLVRDWYCLTVWLLEDVRGWGSFKSSEMKEDVEACWVGTVLWRHRDWRWEIGSRWWSVGIEENDDFRRRKWEVEKAEQHARRENRIAPDTVIAAAILVALVLRNILARFFEDWIEDDMLPERRTQWLHCSPRFDFSLAHKCQPISIRTTDQ